MLLQQTQTITAVTLKEGVGKEVEGGKKEREVLHSLNEAATPEAMTVPLA